MIVFDVLSCVPQFVLLILGVGLLMGAMSDSGEADESASMGVKCRNERIVRAVAGKDGHEDTVIDGAPW